ncbi:MAG: DedA family protein [Candidatus Eremiobacteraeota bacterium]|nr:DedA family protein [Candidatus Eremiobacteraeota bacterium]
MQLFHNAIDWIHWLKDWVLMWAQTPYAPIALLILAFSGSSFFPVPPDLLLVAMCVANPKLALLYALICLVGSVTGGMLGYFIGIKGGKPVLLKFVKEERVEQIHGYFQKYEEWAIGIAGFTPVPYKVFAISAGVFYVDFWKFVIVTVISRGARFFLVAGLIMIFGEKIQYFIDHHFNTLTIAFMALLIGGFLIMKFIKIPHKDKGKDAGSQEPETGEPEAEVQVSEL